MPRSLKLFLIVLIWAAVGALAVFINPRISLYFVQYITFVFTWVFSLFFFGHGNSFLYFLNLIFKLIIALVLLGGEIALALAGMTWVGLRSGSGKNTDSNKAQNE